MSSLAVRWLFDIWKVPCDFDTPACVNSSPFSGNVFQISPSMFNLGPESSQILLASVLALVALALLIIKVSIILVFHSFFFHRQQTSGSSATCSCKIFTLCSILATTALALHLA
jgi:hypothetical protein